MFSEQPKAQLLCSRLKNIYKQLFSIVENNVMINVVSKTIHCWSKNHSSESNIFSMRIMMKSELNWKMQDLLP